MSQRIDFLDGIRGWAAFMVLSGHASLGMLPKATLFKNPLFKMTADGNLAVYIFFVLSGIALSIGFFKKNNFDILTKSATKRYPRLLIPVLFFTLIAYAMLKMGLFYNSQASSITQSTGFLGSFYLFDPDILQALRFSFFDVFYYPKPEVSYNPFLWTLRCELFGSFLVFVLLGALHWTRSFSQLDYKILLAVFLGIVIWTSQLMPSIFCFIVGMGISFLYINHYSFFDSKKIQNYLKILALLGFFFYLNMLLAEMHYPFLLEVKRNKYTVSYLAFILVFTITFIKSFKRIFNNNLAVWLGKISFPLYISHLIVMCSFSSYIITQIPYNDSINFYSTIIYLVTIISSLTIANYLCFIETISIKCAALTAEYISTKLSKQKSKFVCKNKTISF